MTELENELPDDDSSGNLAKLSELLSAVVLASAEAQAAVVSEQKARRVDRRVMIGLIVVSIILASISAGLLVQSRARGIQNRNLFAKIADCTTPGSECYVRAQKNTAEAVAALTVLNFAGQECRYLEETPEGFEECVLKSVPVKLRPTAKSILTQVEVNDGN